MRSISHHAVALTSIACRFCGRSLLALSANAYDSVDSQCWFGTESTTVWRCLYFAPLGSRSTHCAALEAAAGGCGCGTAPRQFMRPGNGSRSPRRISYDDEESNGSGSVARAAVGGLGVRKRSQGRARIGSTTLWWTARSTNRGSPPNRGRSHRQRVGEAADKACQTCGRDAKGERW